MIVTLEYCDQCLFNIRSFSLIYLGSSPLQYNMFGYIMKQKHDTRIIIFHCISCICGLKGIISPFIYPSHTKNVLIISVYQAVQLINKTHEKYVKLLLQIMILKKFWLWLSVERVTCDEQVMGSNPVRVIGGFRKSIQPQSLLCL